MLMNADDAASMWTERLQLLTYSILGPEEFVRT